MAKIDKVQEVASGMTLQRLKLNDLKVYEKNPRVIEKAIPQVMESIRQVGYVTPIVVDEDGVILAGHTRYAALRGLGEEEAEVLVVRGLTEEQKKKYRILDNKTGELATWDKALVRSELEGIDFDGFDFGQPIDFTDIEEEEAEEMPKFVICPRCKAEVQV